MATHNQPWSWHLSCWEMRTHRFYISLLACQSCLSCSFSNQERSLIGISENHWYICISKACHLEYCSCTVTVVLSVWFEFKIHICVIPHKWSASYYGERPQDFLKVQVGNALVGKSGQYEVSWEGWENMWFASVRAVFIHKYVFKILVSSYIVTSYCIFQS